MLNAAPAEPSAPDLLAAADLIRDAINPISLAGNGVACSGASPALREFARATGIGVAETFMGRRARPRDPNALGTVGLQSRDYALAGFEDADAVITIGYDLVEHSLSNRNPKRDKTIVCIDSVVSEVDEHFITEVDLVGDLYDPSARWPRSCWLAPHTPRGSRLDDIALGRFEAAKDYDSWPMQPPRALWEIRKVLGREDMLISDVGLHKLWIARMFPAHEPNTVLIANGLAGMGIALLMAIAAKLGASERHVVTVNGDGGFLMNVQELETAVRLRTPVVNVIWEELPIRLDRLEAGQAVAGISAQTSRTRISSSWRMPSACRFALRGGRGSRRASAARAVARAPQPDRGPDRLLAGCVHL